MSGVVSSRTAYLVVPALICRTAETIEQANPKPRREKKEAFKIDFLTPSEKTPKEIATELFAPVTRGAGITLPGPSGRTTTRKGAKSKKGKDKEEKRYDQTLPDDMHFSSRQLITLFLKPKFSVSSIDISLLRDTNNSMQLKMRGSRHRLDERGDGEVDENFWAQAAANQAAGENNGDADESESSHILPPLFRG